MCPQKSQGPRSKSEEPLLKPPGGQETGSVLHGARSPVLLVLFLLPHPNSLDTSYILSQLAHILKFEQLPHILGLSTRHRSECSVCANSSLLQDFKLREKRLCPGPPTEPHSWCLRMGLFDSGAGVLAHGHHFSYNGHTDGAADPWGAFVSGSSPPSPGGEVNFVIRRETRC